MDLTQVLCLMFSIIEIVYSVLNIYRWGRAFFRSILADPGSLDNLGRFGNVKCFYATYLFTYCLGFALMLLVGSYTNLPVMCKYAAWFHIILVLIVFPMFFFDLGPENPTFEACLYAAVYTLLKLATVVLYVSIS